jgi:hypothetical protein
MERPTQQFELPVSKKIVVTKEWITGREFEIMQKPVLDNYKKGIEAIDIIGVNHSGIEAYVVSVDGKTENVLDLVLDLPSEDYSFVIGKINEVKKKA